jgi:Ax21 family sulfation-dependent quorum factor
MKKSLLALALLAVPALVLSASASAAEGVSYNYLEGGYVTSNLQDSPDADGWAIGGSAAIAPNFHLFGNYSSQELDGTNFDIDNWRLGVGYNHEISQRMDLLTRVAYERYETSVQDFNGYSVEVGLRGAITPMFEGYALAGYEDGSDFDGDFYGRLGAQVKFNQNWGLTGDVKFADNDTLWFVGPRFTF